MSTFATSTFATSTDALQTANEQENSIKIIYLSDLEIPEEVRHELGILAIQQAEKEKSEAIWKLLKQQAVIQFVDPQVEAQVEEQEENYVIHRLIMVSGSHCMICRKRSDSCRTLTMGIEEGWIYCDDCLQTQRLRKVILGYLNRSKTIPLQWLCASINANIKKDYYPNKQSHPEKGGMYMGVSGYLHFFRQSKRDTDEPVHSGLISQVMMSGIRIACKNETKEYCIYLCFPDNETGKCSERCVSLENIMAHTLGFYEELIRSDDLLSSERVKIGFSDLSEELRNDIHDVFRLSCSIPKTSFTS